MSIVSDEDLSTDALPSAPRSDPENENESPTYIPKPEFERRESTSQSKTTEIPHTAFANVINITNSNVVHIGPKVTINTGGKVRKTSDNTQNIITEEVNALFLRKDRVHRNDLVFVAQHIDEKWKHVGKALEYSDGELIAFEHDYEKDGLNEVIFKMLYSWLCRKTKDATVGKLAKVLWNCKQQEAVKLWSADILKR